MMLKNCGNCSYATKTGCKVFKDKQVDCTAWADEKEKGKREKAINEYVSDMFSRRAEAIASAKEENTEKRKGLSTQKALEKYYLKLYDKGLYDYEIADKIHVSVSSVRLYRVKLGLDVVKKNKKVPAGTGE